MEKLDSLEEEVNAEIANVALSKAATIQTEITDFNSFFI